MGSARRGSNPLGVVCCTILCLWSCIPTHPASPQGLIFSMFLGLLPSSDFPDRRFSGQDTPQQASYGPCAWDLGLGMHGRGAWYHLCFTSTNKQDTHHICSSSKTLCPSGQGDGLEIHWALPAGARIPSVLAVQALGAWSEAATDACSWTS